MIAVTAPFAQARPASLVKGHLCLGALDLGAEAKEGQVTAEFYGLLTTEPNAEVGAVPPKAMPAILTEVPEWGLTG